MAITGGDRLVWRSLRARGLIPERPAVLEIGKANWYGDVSAGQAVADWREFSEGFSECPGRCDPWQAADWYYEFMLRGPTRLAIDLDPAAEGAVRHDLNEPSYGGGLYDLVINTGTVEHVFDQRCVWTTIHDACKVGGLMVHAAPLWGWLDHGFFNLNPTLVADVAAENQYEVLAWFIHEIKTGWWAAIFSPEDVAKHQHRAASHSAMLHFALRKTTPDPFRVPMQGVYSNRATPGQRRTWAVNR